MVMTYFERDLYANPDADLNHRWWDYVERFQRLRRPDGRNQPDWAAKVHLALAPVYYQNYLLGEVMSPIKAMLNARDARGTFAQKAIAHQQRRFKAADIAPPSKDQPESLSRDIFYFSLEDQDVPLPLGWMLSDAAAKSIRRQWNFDGGVVRNKTAAEEINRTLPPPAP